MRRWRDFLWAYLRAHAAAWVSLVDARRGLETLQVMAKYFDDNMMHVETGFWRRNSVGFGYDWVTYKVYFSEKFDEETWTWVRTK